MLLVPYHAPRPPLAVAELTGSLCGAMFGVVVVRAVELLQHADRSGCARREDLLWVCNFVY